MNLPDRTIQERLAARGTAFLGSILLSFGACFLIGGGLAIVVNGQASRSVVQPIEFDHREHVQEQGLECLICHPYYETETFSGMPTARACALCHLEPQGESEEERALVALLEEGAPLEWQLIFRQPPHVFYSHRRHVEVAGIECTTCHGDIGDSERPPGRTQQLSMEECIACHEREGVTNHCTTCHR